MYRTLPVVLLLIALAASACSSGCISLFAPKADLADSPIVDQLQEPPTDAQPFDHSAYGELLGEHVDYEAARVDYDGLKRDEARLDAYLDQIAQADLSGLDEDARHALLINAYNAYTLKLIVEHYPGIDSIKDIDSPWKTSRWVVAGHTLSLDDIEHGLIRPIYRDSRIHFAVNCAAVGCPPLAAEPYEGASLEAQLDRATRRALHDERYARVTDGRLELTQVMNWYRKDFLDEDFSPRAQTLAAYAARYGTDELRDFVEAHDGDPPVGFIDYDWRLNSKE